jgi:hypothetical protein
MKVLKFYEMLKHLKEFKKINLKRCWGLQAPTQPLLTL